MTIKAIETSYKGYRFRSRLEARWAVFFDHIGLRWEYEPEGFELGGGVRYLPDFKLTDGSTTWIEVKGGDPTDSEIAKMSKLCEADGSYGLIVSGEPGKQQWLWIHKEGHVDDCSNWQVDSCTGRTLADFLGTDWREYEHAAIAARSARFEFGQSGARR